jgi:hypothetical protein
VQSQAKQKAADGEDWLELVFGAVARAGDPDEEIVVQKVVPTRPELSLEIGVLWLGLGDISISASQSQALLVPWKAIRSLHPTLCLSIGERQDHSLVLLSYVWVARHLLDSDR